MYQWGKFAQRNKALVFGVVGVAAAPVAGIATTSYFAVREALTYSYLGLIAGCWILIPIPLYVGYLGFGMGLILIVCFLCSFIISPFLWSILRPKFLFPKDAVLVGSKSQRAAV